MGDVKRDDGAALIAAERRRQIESETNKPEVRRCPWDQVKTR